MSTGAGNLYDNIFTSPYVATINNAVPTAVICDDFGDDVSVGESWLVTGSTVADLASNVKWKTDSNIPGYNEQQSYDAAAWLAEQLTSANTNVVSYAIWAVFDPNGADGVYSYLAGNSLLSSVKALVSTAENNNYTSVDFSNVSVYTAVSGSQPWYDGPPQEFLVVHTPEPSSASALAIDFLGLLALATIFRRRIFSAAN